AQNSGSSRSRR
ncbi:hypothetical protein D039_3171B, partial [Vibrio parahaemolyticus EKP-028]